MGVGERQGERETEIDKNYSEGRRQRDSKEKETEG